MKRRLLLRVIILLVVVAASLLAFSHRKVGARAALKTVIVQLASDPAVVAKFRAESAGQTFDVEAYRRRVIAEQETFLTRATAAGIAYTVAGVNAPNGEVTRPSSSASTTSTTASRSKCPRQPCLCLRRLTASSPSTRRRPSTPHSTAP